MDLGCLDMCCISVSDTSEAVLDLDSDNKPNDASESLTATSKIGKNKQMKENGQSTLNSLNKSNSQIKKPGHRKNSPINWFPRKKVDSYLNRKIKMLQEVAGMNLTLDETLGDSNPHYSKVLREKMATREAANKAIEARKAALVEASWCRILKAARIQRKEAEEQLLKAEKTAAEAFEAALAIGVNMYDIPNCPKKPSQVDTSSSSYSREGSTTHAVTGSFETAFDVDKEVAAAVKTALIRLASCHSFEKDEFKDLLRKIRQNPDTAENDGKEQSEDSSPKCESKSGSENEAVSRTGSFSSPDSDCTIPVSQPRQRRRSRRRQSLEKLNKFKLINVMFDRLQLLQEDELSSLATIVATCGLNAALAEIETNKLGSSAHYRTSNTGIESQRRLSCFQGKKQTEPDLPSLDKFLVKHMTKLEREVLEARNSRKESFKEGIGENSVNTSEGKFDLDKNETSADLGSVLLKHSSKFEKEIEEGKKKSVEDSRMGGDKSLKGDTVSSESIPDLGSILIKHSSKPEKEIEEARKNYGKKVEGAPNRVKEDGSELPGLDKFLVKRVSRLEREVQEAKMRRTNQNDKVNSPASSVVIQEERSSSSNSEEGLKGKENIDLNKVAKNEFDRNTSAQTKENEDSLDKILVKRMHRLEREKMQASALGNDYRYEKVQKKHGGNVGTECESLDKVLVKHVSKLEREKMRVGSEEEEGMKVKNDKANTRRQTEESGGLDQILVKHKSRLEREKMAAAHQPEDRTRPSVARREARERELQEAWGGLSLGNSMKPHLSKLERDKAAWIKAEEEERKQCTVFSD
ncbi:hypothetical protein TIFTF001_007145 [Ficus carica]|uniref:Uncharacterized protein n=1 Tax=Ficus carica TaxID=3494 RepID=A0AA88ACR9_FICCA|nr:hypothetical protein TIFTF001_007145 [Ficus carica]